MILGVTECEPAVSIVAHSNETQKDSIDTGNLEVSSFAPFLQYQVPPPNRHLVLWRRNAALIAFKPAHSINGR